MLLIVTLVIAIDFSAVLSEFSPGDKESFGSVTALFPIILATLSWSVVESSSTVSERLGF